jgi:hypothetical protein
MVTRGIVEGAPGGGPVHEGWYHCALAVSNGDFKRIDTGGDGD